MGLKDYPCCTDGDLRLCKLLNCLSSPSKLINYKGSRSLSPVQTTHYSTDLGVIPLANEMVQLVQRYSSVSSNNSTFLWVLSF